MSVARAAAVSAVVALLCCALSLAGRETQIGGAATHVLLDGQKSWILDPKASNTDFAGLAARAELLGNLIASPPVQQRIGRRIGVPANQIAAVSRTTANVTAVMREPDSEQRATQILAARKPYRLETQADPARPILSIYAQAPSAAAAERLADATVEALRAYLASRPVSKLSRYQPLKLEQLGHARGAVINGGTSPQIAVLTFTTVFALCFGLLLLLPRIRRGWRERATPRPRRVRALAVAVGGDDWPRTTRILPWMVAGFLALLWLVPFNTIQLSASLPFDLKLDRLVLPVVIGVWIVALAVGGPGAPRIRMTGIHAGVAAFVAVACLGVVLNAYALNQTLEFDLASKKLTLLISYALLFVIVASSVRRTEVHAFLKFTLGLAVICALGTIWEYRFHYNVFYELSRHAPARDLPGRRRRVQRRRRHRAATDPRSGRASARDRRDAVDGPADRARLDDAGQGATRAHPLRASPRASCSPRRSRPTARARCSRPGRRLPDARLLPPARAPQARAAGGRSRCSSSTSSRRARSARSSSSCRATGSASAR